MGRIIDSLNDKMPSLVKVDNEVYEAIFGKIVYTENSPVEESSDHNCGAIVNELEFVKAFINYIIDSFDPALAETDLLEKIVYLFLAMERIYEESDVLLRNRMRAYLIRNDNPRWSTGWSFKDIFLYFFERVEIEENYVETNLVLNGSFEDATGDDFDNWTETPSGSSTIVRDTSNPFENSACCKFNIDSSNNTATVSQILSSVAAGNYKLGFWRKDDVSGIYWAQQTSSFGTSIIYAVAHNQSNLWVAVGQSGKLATSPDGSSWTQRTNPFGSSGINFVAYNGSNLWVAVGNDGKLATSANGIDNWTLQTSSFGSDHIYGVAHNQSNLWVAIGMSGKLATSEDGITWTSRTSTFSTTLRRAFYSDGLWVIVSLYGGLATSEDGISWVQRDLPFDTSHANDVCHDGIGLWVAVGNDGKLATSSDGITWTSRASSFGSDAIYTVRYCSLGIWVAAGANGKLATSDNGVDWIQRTSSFGTSPILGVDFDGSDVWVAAGYTGKLATSTSCPTDTPMKMYVRRSGDNYYYNFDDNSWQSGAVDKKFEKTFEWTYGWGFINNADTRDLTIYFENNGGSGIAYAFQIDRVMFGVWQDYPSIKLLLIFEGQTGAGNVFLAPGDDDNLIDRGECESTTTPAMFDETSETLSNALWARDGTQYYWGTYSYKATKNIASGTEATVNLTDNTSTSDMHGFEVGKTYTFMVRIRIPSGAIGASEVLIRIADYEGSWANTEQAAAAVYDAWQYVTVTRTIRSGATGATIQIALDSTAELNELIYVDDIRVIEGEDDNILYASFIDQDFIAGEGGGYSSDFYLNLLDKARPAGVKGDIETILRLPS